MVERWFAIQTIAKREALTAANFAASAIETFLPMFRESYRVKTKHQTYLSHTTGPLFPGYLFARFDLGDWPLIRKSRGVRVVRVGDRPARVDDWIIEGLRERMNEAGYAESVKRIYDDLAPGTVVVGCGHTSWAGIAGIFLEGLSGGERVAVLMTIMGGERRVVLPRADVEPMTVQSAAGVQH